MAVLLTVYADGCGQGDEEVQEEISSTAFISSSPSQGTIEPNSTITVTFDHPPEDVEVNAGLVKVDKAVVIGQTLTITGPFPPGPLVLTILWADGVQTLNYTVAASELIAIPGAAVSVGIFPASVASPPPGEHLILDINITDGEDIAGYQLTLDFDATALRYVSSSNADYLPVGAFVIPPLVETNQVTLAATSLNGGSQDAGTPATVTLEVIAVKPSALILSEVRLTDTEANFLRVSAGNAEVVE